MLFFCRYDSDYTLKWELEDFSRGLGMYASIDYRIPKIFRTDAIRVVFEGLPLGNFTNDTQIFHAISEIEVGKRLVCSIQLRYQVSMQQNSSVLYTRKTFINLFWNVCHHSLWTTVIFIIWAIESNIDEKASLKVEIFVDMTIVEPKILA